MHRIFVVGCSRSGTTIVQRILANHPTVLSFPETGFYRQLCGNRIWTQVAKLGWVRQSRFRRARDRTLRVLTHLSLPDPPGPTSPLARTSAASSWLIANLDAAATRQGCCAWVEKTPIHHRSGAVIARTIPDSRILHVLRDGREVTASMRDRAIKFPKQFGDQYPVEFLICQVPDDCVPDAGTIQDGSAASP